MHRYFIRRLFSKYLINFILMIGAIMPVSLFAQIQCPNNNLSVELGNDINQVQAACGPPAKINTFEGAILNESAETKKAYYFFAVAGQTVKLVFTLQGPVNHTRVVAINDRGQPVQATNLCGQTVKIGDSINTLKEICDAATYVENVAKDQGQASNTAQSVEVTELTYQGNQTSTVFVFQNKVLKYVTNE